MPNINLHFIWDCRIRPDVALRPRNCVPAFFACLCTLFHPKNVEHLFDKYCLKIHSWKRLSRNKFFIEKITGTCAKLREIKKWIICITIWFFKVDWGTAKTGWRYDTYYCACTSTVKSSNFVILLSGTIFFLQTFFWWPHLIFRYWNLYKMCLAIVQIYFALQQCLSLKIRFFLGWRN